MTFSGTAAVLVAVGVLAAWVPARHVLPYIYGILVCMKKTLHIDERLLRRRIGFGLEDGHGNGSARP
jgi:hypothetical protein